MQNQIEVLTKVQPKKEVVGKAQDQKNLPLHYGLDVETVQHDCLNISQSYVRKLNQDQFSDVNQKSGI